MFAHPMSQTFVIKVRVYANIHGWKLKVTVVVSAGFSFFNHLSSKISYCYCKCSNSEPRESSSLRKRHIYLKTATGTLQYVCIIHQPLVSNHTD